MIQHCQASSQHGTPDLRSSCDIISHLQTLMLTEERPFTRFATWRLYKLVLFAKWLTFSSLQSNPTQPDIHEVMVENRLSHRNAVIEADEKRGLYHGDLDLSEGLSPSTRTLQCMTPTFANFRD